MMMNGQNGQQMDPMMMMMMMGDDSSSMKDLLPLMMMNGQNGQQMDPMMMMSLLDDSSSMSDLLPLMMMNGQGQQGGMNPMMMMSLLGDDCSYSAELEALDLDSDIKKQLATGAIAWKVNVDGDYDSAAAYDAAIAAQYVDYDFLACKNKGGMDPMMMSMMGGQNMDPMTTLMMLDGGSMDDLLPLMMMGGQGQEGQGQMNPMMMMSLLGDDTKTKKACDADYNVKSFFTAGATALESSSDIADIRSGIEGLATKTANQDQYVACLSEATEEGSEKSKMDKMLPLMMMGGQGQQMNPMMMMSLLGGDDSSMSDLLPLMMMGGQQPGQQMDPMMMMMLMKD